MLEGRIIKGVGGLYTVDTVQGEYACKARGIFRKRKITPVVGDYVKITLLKGEENIGIIDEIMERKTFLIRPRVANIDQAVLIFAAVTPDINVDLLDRFILACEMENVEIVLCINKADIINLDDYADLKEIYEQIGYQVIFTSAENKMGTAELRTALKDKVSVFAGPSGAGKSSLVNVIIPHANMETGLLSEKISRGKHTTRHTQLIKAFENSYVVDSPGFTSLFLENIAAEELQNYFREFRACISRCRFADCNHINEPECAVKEAVDKGIISKMRYERYINIYNEIVQMKN